MMNFTLKRQDHEHPMMEELNAMRDGLEMLISSDLNSPEFDWFRVVQEIVPFQYSDGSFNLLDSYRIESDCRVYYCHEPTYICTALLMKALLVDETLLTGKEDIILPRALHMCCARGLKGHGFDDLKGQVNALNYFIRCDVKAFIEKYPDLCPEFTSMIQNIAHQYAFRVKTSAFKGSWGDDYEPAIRKIHEYFDFDCNFIFVYGTLMKGQANHAAFLSNAKLIAQGEIFGFRMYNLGCYPGIVRGKGFVEGEVYCVSDSELDAIDRLEGEGVLYTRETVDVQIPGSSSMIAFAYIYNGSVRGRKNIGSRYPQSI